MKPLLIIKAGYPVKSVPQHAGDFADWIIRGMALPQRDFLVADVVRGEPLPAPQAIRGALITGSPAMVTDRADWSLRTAAWILGLAETAVPLLGICYGHQLIAQALGGEAGWHPRGREIGTVPVNLCDGAGQDALFRGLPSTFPAHSTHSQTILRLPEGGEVLAANGHERYHGVRFRETIWGVQFHPEFNAPVMRAYISERMADLQLEGLDASMLLAQVTETPDAERALRNFAALCQPR